MALGSMTPSVIFVKCSFLRQVGRQMEFGPPNPELKSLKYGVEFKKSFGLQGGSSFSVKMVEIILKNVHTDFLAIRGGYVPFFDFLDLSFLFTLPVCVIAHFAIGGQSKL